MNAYEVFSDASHNGEIAGCSFRVTRGREIVTEGGFTVPFRTSLSAEIKAVTAGVRKTPDKSFVIVNCDVENLVSIVDRPHRISYAESVLEEARQLRNAVRRRTVGFRCHKNGHHGWCHKKAREVAGIANFVPDGLKSADASDNPKGL